MIYWRRHKNPEIHFDEVKFDVLTLIFLKHLRAVKHFNYNIFSARNHDCISLSSSQNSLKECQLKLTNYNDSRNYNNKNTH